MDNKTDSKSGFRNFLTFYLITLGSAFLGYSAFIADIGPEDRKMIIMTILGFVMGTVLHLVIGFHFSSSQGSKDKDTPKQNDRR